MLQSLMKSKDFLALTLANPLNFPQSLTFSLGEHTDVEIWDTGVIVFEPRDNQGKNIILSSAIHGNETAPIEICNGLINKLLNQDIIAKQRVLFLFGNPAAVNNGSRFIDENLNRLFNGAYSKGGDGNTPERLRAKNLEAYVGRFFDDNKSSAQRYHYDLHTAIRGSRYEKFAIHPYRSNQVYTENQLQFLQACGIESLVFYHEVSTTFSSFSSEGYQAEAFTVELGKVLPMGQNDMSCFKDITAMLTRLITNQPLQLPVFDSKKMSLYQVSRSIDKEFDDFEFTFANDVKNFTLFSKGEVLAREGGKEILVEHEQEAIIFPNSKVPVGQRSGLSLTPLKKVRLK